MSTVISLPFAIVQYLKEEIERGKHSDAEIESLQVATDCLQAVYNVDYDQGTAQFSCQPKLRDIFSSARALGYFGVSDNGSEKTKIDTAEQLKNEGNDFIRAEKFEPAIRSYSDAIDLCPNNAIYYCNRAAAYIKISRFDAAEADCKKSITLNPKYSRAFWRLGVAQSNLHRYESAEKNFRKAHELEPQNQSYLEALQHSVRVLESEKRTEPTPDNSASTMREESGASSQNATPGGDTRHPQGTQSSEAQQTANANNSNTNQTDSASQNQNQPGAQPSGIPNMNNLNFGSLFSNPNIMNMAMQMMNDPQMMNMVSGAFQGGGLDGLRSMGQRMANENPELVGELKEKFKKDSE
ncbi:Small glutamine-rich tetratricopeptide repeat-containing protein beta [Trichoplax sp. H2]|nr:Small glutamine-rich tetratricopeptide repeat-containing protein beta [Trichoplax sp. H2]|eukprot:RDD43683.1 Small glutamine-rich tetratricopeptide repeat-containing protein beta [Trichoplax sp. H2]